MSEVLNNYIASFLHPWHTQDLLRERRRYQKDLESPQQLELVQEEKTEVLEEEVGVSFEQSLCISWLFTILSGFYMMIGHLMGIESFKSFSLEDALLDSFQIYWVTFLIIFFFGKIVFFPLYFWFYGKFWINIIRVFSTLFEKDKEIEVDIISEEIVSNAFTSHTLMLIPIVGEFLHRITSLIYIFGGLKRNLQFNNLQAGLVIICPLMLFLFAFFLMALSVGMGLSSL